MVLSEVVGRNFLKDPGLHRSILADGTAMMFASLLGGPPSTTYWCKTLGFLLLHVSSLYSY